MGVSTQDMINQLLAQTTVAPQPSFMGLSGPPDPGQLKQLLSKLQQNQFLQNNSAPTPGPYGYLHDAGKSQMLSVGQALGNQVGMALPPGQVPPQPGQSPQTAPTGAPQSPQAAPPGAAAEAPAPTLTNPQSISAAIRQVSQAHQAMIASGLDPDVADYNAFKLATSLGVPGAADKLADAQDKVLKNAQTRAETAKNTSQSNMDNSDITKNDVENKSKQFKTTYTDPAGYFFIQTDGNGKSERVELKPGKPPFVPPDDASSDSIAQKIANYDLQLSTVAGRGGPEARQYWLTKALALNPDYDEKNFKQSQDALKAYGPSGTQGQMMLKTQNAMNHLDALDKWHQALQTGDTKAANAAAQYLSNEFGGAAISTYQAAAPIVANEVSSSLVKGGGSKEERTDRVAALTGTKGDAALSAATGAMRSLLGAQYKNNQNLYEQTTLRKDFDKRFPVAGGFPPPPGGPAAAPTGAPPADGWGPVKKN
jgi:hypothetical protein